MKHLIEVCVYVPWGREIMTRKCYDKEIPWHWNDETNGLLAPLSGMALRAIPSSCGYGYYVWLYYAWLLCMVTMYGYYVWLLCMVTIYGFYVWLLCMVTMYGYTMYGYTMYGYTMYGYYVWLLCMVTMYGYYVWLLWLFVEESYSWFMIRQAAWHLRAPTFSIPGRDGSRKGPRPRSSPGPKNRNVEDKNTMIARINIRIC